MQFDPDIPPACPPVDAEPTNLTVYRFVDSVPADASHFRSSIREGRQKCNPAVCKVWGMSVWSDIEGARHARELFDDMRYGWIVAVPLAPTDGVWKPTPNAKQSKHCTFWCAHDNDISPKAEIVLEPEAEDD